MAAKTPSDRDEVGADEEYISIPGFLFEYRAENNAPLQELMSLFDNLDSRLRSLAEAFLHNLHSVYQLLGLPFDLVFQNSHNSWLWSNIFMVLGREYPETGFPVMKLTQSAFIDVFARAYDKARYNIDGEASFVRMSLAKFSEEASFVSASRELLNQGLVLTWSSLEVLVGDACCIMMNTLPQFVERLRSDSSTKKNFVPDRISLEQLSEFGFDLSSAMGTLLTRDLNLSSIAKMKSISSALFNSSELRAALDSPTLFLLSERRHLIVHRRGVVDAKYVRTARDGRVEGERLQVEKQELETALKEVACCGLYLLRAANKIMEDPRQGGFEAVPEERP